VRTLASSLVRRKAVRLSKGAPPYVRTNIEIPAIPVGRQTLYLFPDRLLVFERSGVGAVGYDRLKIQRRSTRFIEDGTVPGGRRHRWGVGAGTGALLLALKAGS
jgi:hypothetical protein